MIQEYLVWGGKDWYRFEFYKSQIFEMSGKSFCELFVSLSFIIFQQPVCMQSKLVSFGKLLDILLPLNHALK